MPDCCDDCCRKNPYIKCWKCDKRWCETCWRKVNNGIESNSASAKVLPWEPNVIQDVCKKCINEDLEKTWNIADRCKTCNTSASSSYMVKDPDDNLQYMETYCLRGHLMRTGPKGKWWTNF